MYCSAHIKKEENNSKIMKRIPFDAGGKYGKFFHPIFSFFYFNFLHFVYFFTTSTSSFLGGGV
jgi:hypothetical protein